MKIQPTYLAGASLVLSVVASAFAIRASRGFEIIEVSLSGPPALPPAMIRACDGKAPVANLADLMTQRINPAVTKISFALHHDSRESTERLEEVAQISALLIGCVRQASGYHPSIGLDKMSDYFGSLDDMQANALAVQISALENDEEGVKHWFNHLKQDCVACHTRFRPAGEVAAAKP